MGDQVREQAAQGASGSQAITSKGPGFWSLGVSTLEGMLTGAKRALTANVAKEELSLPTVEELLTTLALEEQEGPE